MSVLVRISAPHFVAGLIFADKVCIEAAPIIRYMRGWPGRKVREYCRTKRWVWEVIEA